MWSVLTFRTNFICLKQKDQGQHLVWRCPLSLNYINKTEIPGRSVISSANDYSFLLQDKYTFNRTSMPFDGSHQFARIDVVYKYFTIEWSGNKSLSVGEVDFSVDIFPVKMKGEKVGIHFRSLKKPFHRNQFSRLWPNLKYFKPLFPKIGAFNVTRDCFLLRSKYFFSSWES